MDPQLLKQIAPYLVPLLVVALMARRIIRNPPRKVRIASLWVAPMIALLGTGTTLAMAPMPQLFWIVGFAAAAALGGTIGFLTSHHQEFSIDYETGTITSRATPIGLILFAGLFAVRYALRFAFPQMSGGYAYGGPMVHPSADVLAWTDAGLIFSTAMLLARAATTFLRTRPLIEAHKAQKAAASSASPEA